MIFITGCARSGTSLTTKILEALGADLGREGGASINGLYENLDIREKVIKPYLRTLGVDPLGQHPLPELPLSRDYPYFRAELREKMKGGNVYKCAKAVLIWPLFRKHFPEARYVLVRRRKEKIVDSCLRTSFMRAFTDKAGWEEWVDEHVRRMDDMKEHLYCEEVWTDDYIRDPEKFRLIARFCGLEFNPDIISGCIERGRWHG